MLKTKAVTLAVAGALGVPVAAFAQNVQIYGKVYPQFGTLKTSGASSAADLNPLINPAAAKGDLKSRTNVDSSNSRLGFRGAEDLGGGLKAIFQIESKVSIDNPTNSRVFATRDSFVGLAGGFGTVKLGNMDTVYKQLGDPIGILGISSGNFVSDSAVLSKGPLSGINFHQREKNSIVYESPAFGGVQLLAQYASPVSEESKAAGSNLKASTQSYGVKYEVGPLYLAAAHEIRKDQFMFSSSTNLLAAFTNPTTGATVHSKDSATRAAVMYQFPTRTKVSLDVAQLKLEETGGAAGHFEGAKNKRWAVTAEQGLGNVRVAASYAKSDKGTCTLAGGAFCTTDGFETSQFNLGAMLSLSKRTGVFAIYSRLTNGNSAMASNADAFDTVSPGADTTQAAVGISHSF
jgi:predicted porin